jgi:VanZ family protein
LSSKSTFYFRFRVPPGSDKIAHAFIYFVLCWLTRRAFFHQKTFPLLRDYALMGAFVFSAVYGVLDEYHQSFVPGRSVDFHDFLADCGGALLYSALFWLLQRRNGGKEQAGQG